MIMSARQLLLLTALLVPVAANEPALSPALLAALDPTTQAQALCAPRRAGPSRALLAAAAVAAPASETGGVPYLADLAATRLSLGPAQPQARRWFTQGLMLSYGFNHAGAVASFRRAQALAPDCALC